jgi:hypothetical protein
MHLAQFHFALQHNVEILAHITDAVQHIVAAAVDDASGARQVALRVFGQVRTHLCGCVGGERREAKR